MRPSLNLSTDGKEFFIEVHNLFGEFNVYPFEEPEPTEHNIKLHIHRLFDIFKEKTQTEKQRIKVDRFFAQVRNDGRLLDGIKIKE